MKNETKAEKIIRKEIEKYSILKPTSMAKDIMKAIKQANLIFAKADITETCPKCGSTDIMMFTSDLDLCGKCGAQF